MTLEEQIKEVIESSHDLIYTMGYQKGLEEGRNENPKAMICGVIFAALLFGILLLLNINTVA